MYDHISSYLKAENGQNSRLCAASFVMLPDLTCSGADSSYMKREFKVLPVKTHVYTSLHP